jgi:hypothetical protein
MTEDGTPLIQIDGRTHIADIDEDPSITEVRGNFLHGPQTAHRVRREIWVRIGCSVGSVNQCDVPPIPSPADVRAAYSEAMTSMAL